MAASKIPVYKSQNYDDSMQTAPAWMVTFVRFSQRSNENKNPIGVDSGLTVRKTLPVISDCYAISVNQTKNNFAHSAEISLLSGDINYSTAIAPGDYFIVNMVDDENKILDLYNRANNNQPINRYDDGFKGLFRVQSVGRTLSVDSNGNKRLLFKVTGYAFSEFNNTIYFNPFLVQEYMKTPLFFLTAISDNWNKKIKDGQYNSVQNVIMALYDAFLGKSVASLDGMELKEGLEKSKNRPYTLPGAIMQLMGCSGSNVCDIQNVIVGKQTYNVNGSNGNDSDKLKPMVSNAKNRTYRTPAALEGHSYAKPEYFSQVKVWDILNQYLNGAINEMYATFKPDPSGKDLILPTLVIREKPFTTNKFAKSVQRKTTPFLSLPRWEASYDYVMSASITRDDAARFNFVQIFGRNQSNSPNASISFQTKAGNYVFDTEDVKRSGLRPFVATIPFDYFKIASSTTVSDTPYWARLVGDWLIGGHLKMSGTVTMAGVEKPMTVGDNFQLADMVYHIESVSHVASVNPDGTKNFRTTLQLSSGLLDDDSTDYVPYAEMEFTAGDSMRDEDFRNYGDILPGVSDSQDLPGANNRAAGERKAGDENETKERSFSSRDRKKRK